MVSEFTKGPWRVGMSNGYPANTVCDSDDGSICTVYGIPLHTHTSDVIDPRWVNEMANAHLIAAAPELYEALLEAIEQLERNFIVVPEAWTKAIAKAEGK